LRGESLRRQICSALIERDSTNWASGWQRDYAAFVRQFGYPETPGNPPRIAINQLGFRRTANLSAGDHVQQHSSALVQNNAVGANQFFPDG
jgi:hypothetical protein